MRSVKIYTSKLLETLKNNREKHIADYKEAMKGFREDAIAAMEKNLALAKDGKGINLYINNVVLPTSYEDSYNTIIKMLEFSTDTTVELTMQEFSQYVEDKWAWKQTFAETAAFYNNKRADF